MRQEKGAKTAGFCGFVQPSGMECSRASGAALFVDKEEMEILSELATALSGALQFGVPIAALAKSVGRAPNASTMPGSLDQLNAGSQPASSIGAALDLLMAHEPRPNGAPSSE